MFVVRTVMVTLLTATLGAAVGEVNDCEWRKTTRISTEKFEILKEKHKLYLSVIPQFDNTAVNITIVSPDGEKRDSKSPMFGAGKKSYKPYENGLSVMLGQVITVGGDKTAQWYFCFSDQSPTARPWLTGSQDTVSAAFSPPGQAAPPQDTSVPDSNVTRKQPETLLESRNGAQTLDLHVVVMVMMLMWLVMHVSNL